MAKEGKVLIPREIRTCVICRKQFEVIATSRKKTCGNSKCRTKLTGEKKRGKSLKWSNREEARKKISEAKKRDWALGKYDHVDYSVAAKLRNQRHPDLKEKQLKGLEVGWEMMRNGTRKLVLKGSDNPMYGKHHSEKTKKLLSQRTTEQFRNIEYRRLLSQKAKERCRDLSVIRKILQFKRPTSLEKKMDEFLQRHFPNQWKYTGNGSFVVGGKNPDFVHTSKKYVILVNGEHWHQDIFEEPVQINHYLQYGYNCIVIWENELKHINTKKLKQKIVGGDTCGQEIAKTAQGT